MKRQQKGFTLIELLVVMAIIGLLSTLAVVSLNTARIKSRDTARVATIKQMQSALEMYYSDKKIYPTSAEVTSTIATSGVVYMQKFTDPGNNAITYTQRQNTTMGDSYTLEYTLENGIANINTSGGNGAGGLATATPDGISL